jgi:hypothetical protein
VNSRADQHEPPRALRNGMSTSVWCVVAAFGAYFCVYAFRKPFTAGMYADPDAPFWGVGYKSMLVISQMLGYALSKFLGIRFVAEVQPRRRVAFMLGLIAVAELSLLLFGLTPRPWNFFWLFFNGLPLGMTFGLVLGFLEGRHHTEALAAGLCVSFILADGVAKSTGASLLASGVAEHWMPFLAGLVFVPPLMFFAWMLSRIPAPSAHDVSMRSERAPMDRSDRRAFFKRYAGGLMLLSIAYLLITVLRSVRADFAPELWKGLGVDAPPAVFSQSEAVVAIGAALLAGSAVLVRDNRKAFFGSVAIAIVGSALIIASLVGLRWGLFSPFGFVVLNGLGLYLPYIVVHTTVFERLIAMTRDRGNIGYLMYLVDSIGYLGYVGVLMARKLVQPTEDFLTFFVWLSWIVAIGSVAMLIPMWRYFALHPATKSLTPMQPASAPLMGALPIEGQP